ncbi:hypothetical protein JKP88DRAFT_254325 [Tribonema minus]|uniref:Uncharacterized protein n=1 Tax=Tribonema minus TaxID=303371 RepID=A0A836CIJ3_9STRA|nr:hypothetical protein JKP88DRAFT_254325 [Tribonema minus]
MQAGGGPRPDGATSAVAQQEPARDAAFALLQNRPGTANRNFNPNLQAAHTHTATDTPSTTRSPIEMLSVLLRNARGSAVGQLRASRVLAPGVIGTQQFVSSLHTTNRPFIAGASSVVLSGTTIDVIGMVGSRENFRDLRRITETEFNTMMQPFIKSQPGVVACDFDWVTWGLVEPKLQHQWTPRSYGVLQDAKTDDLSNLNIQNFQPSLSGPGVPDIADVAVTLQSTHMDTAVRRMMFSQRSTLFGQSNGNEVHALLPWLLFPSRDPKTGVLGATSDRVPPLLTSLVATGLVISKHAFASYWDANTTNCLGPQYVLTANIAAAAAKELGVPLVLACRPLHITALRMAEAIVTSSSDPVMMLRACLGHALASAHTSGDTTKHEEYYDVLTRKNPQLYKAFVTEHAAYTVEGLLHYMQSSERSMTCHGHADVHGRCPTEDDVKRSSASDPEQPPAGGTARVVLGGTIIDVVGVELNRKNVSKWQAMEDKELMQHFVRGQPGVVACDFDWTTADLANRHLEGLKPWSYMIWQDMNVNNTADLAPMIQHVQANPIDFADITDIAVTLDATQMDTALRRTMLSYFLELADHSSFKEVRTLLPWLMFPYRDPTTGALGDRVPPLATTLVAMGLVTSKHAFGSYWNASTTNCRGPESVLTAGFAGTIAQKIDVPVVAACRPLHITALRMAEAIVATSSDPMVMLRACLGHADAGALTSGDPVRHEETYYQALARSSPQLYKAFVTEHAAYTVECMLHYMQTYDIKRGCLLVGMRHKKAVNQYLKAKHRAQDVVFLADELPGL